ncbi:uncharacterized protein FIBRA_06329 [Fibroporia radiculosa]|uniref:Efficient mitochondria targeting-associated protein 19 n=1 Tax=Fibroporia radiculosa TaxID=599839 RepID=J4HYY1_9APHY|nr:uncharacterized protein FIBRA_06329 [Fibroporia radiculosa]CCM04167.1 predicted protein [Fibroporia radiculosa]
MSKKSLVSRPLDLLYFSFFAMHATATILMDLQVIYPPSLVPPFMKALTDFYISNYGDPLIGGVMGLLGRKEDFVWFHTFVMVEAFFQLPVFFIGMRGLWKDSRSIYVLLLVYATSATITALPCVTVLLATPFTSPETIAANIVSITPAQRTMLLSSYIPFFLLPLLMVVDLSFRVLKLVNAGVAAERAAKQK